MQTTISSRRAGQLTVDTADGFADNLTVQTDDGTVELWVHVFDSVSQDAVLLGRVGGVLDAFPELLQLGRAALEAGVADGGEVLPFVEFHAEELARPHLELALSQVRGGVIGAQQIAALFVPKSFVLTRDDAGELACWIDFVLPPFESDQVLAVKFTSELTVKSLDWES